MQAKTSYLLIESVAFRGYQPRMELSLRIREIRKERGLTIAELAAKIGVSAPHLSEVERGVKNVNNHLLTRLASALGVRPDQLISGADQESVHRLADALRRLSKEDRERVEAFALALVQSSQESQRSE